MASKCSVAMIEFINELKKQIPDEQQARYMYADMATKLHDIRLKGEAVPGSLTMLDSIILEKISADEASHKVLLEAMSEILSKECEE
jgi:hypothetical protein